MSSIEERTRRGAGYVYFIRASNGLVKIGCAVNPRKRFVSCRTDSPLPLEMLFVVRSANASSLEGRLHEAFSARHSHGEWFALTEADLERLQRDYGIAEPVTPVETRTKAKVLPGFIRPPRARAAKR